MTQTPPTTLHSDLAARFPPGTVKSYKSGKDTMYYIDARDACDRLDAAAGPLNWSDRYEVLDLESFATKCTLTVYGVSKEGIGYPNHPVGTLNSKGERIDSKEPLKEAESDALKRAAQKFGIGRYIYQDKPPTPHHDDTPEPPAQRARTDEPTPIETARANRTPPTAGDKPATDSQKRAIKKLSEDLGDPIDTDTITSYEEAGELISSLSKSQREAATH